MAMAILLSLLLLVSVPSFLLTRAGDPGSGDTGGGKTRAADDWNQFLGDERNSGLGPDAGTPTPEMVWKFGTGSGIESSPAVVQGKVFFGSKDGSVSCLDALTGVEKWTFGTGGDISCSPLVLDGKVYIGSGDRNLYCLNAEYGLEQWNFTTGGAVIGSPKTYGDNLYFGSSDGALYCLWPNGTEKWHFSISGSRTDVWSTPSFSDGLLYIGDSSGRLVCLDSDTGEFLFDILTAGDIYSSVCISGDAVYFTSGIDRKVYRYNGKTGQQEWAFDTPTDTYSSPAVLDGKVYFTDYEHVYCIPSDDPDGNGFITPGEVIWKYRADNFEGGSSPLLVSDLLLVGMENDLLCLNAANGTLEWSFETGGKVVSSPVYAGDLLYIGSDDGFLYCLRGSGPDSDDADETSASVGKGLGEYLDLIIPITIFAVIDLGLLIIIICVYRRRRSDKDAT